jgi:hypothetical protein
LPKKVDKRINSAKNRWNWKYFCQNLGVVKIGNTEIRSLIEIKIISMKTFRNLGLFLSVVRDVTTEIFKKARNNGKILRSNYGLITV